MNRHIDLQQPYNRKYFTAFLKHFLPEDYESSEENIPLQQSKGHIREIRKLGQSPSLGLPVYEIIHESDRDPRVALSRTAFSLMSLYGNSRGLFIFTSQKSNNYRLSLTTIDLKLEGSKVCREYSNPRRYSFFIGPEAKINTPYNCLIKKGRIKDVEDLKNRFSLEVVNKEFYTQIAILFTKLVGGERKIGSKKLTAKGILSLPCTEDDTVRKEFAVRLIGRLLFCWFLKKKCPENGGTMLVPEALLSVKAINDNYYHNILEPLFFGVLNTPPQDRRQEYKTEPWNKIPFLNGGLFSPHMPHDFFTKETIDSRGISFAQLKIPDAWFKEIFTVFETYNFTIDENTSIDVELSIDPEMLGRIFENLLAEINPETGETARKKTGSYYTPRSIVEYMVDQSIKEYLKTNTSINEERISELLAYEKEAHNLNTKEKEEVTDALYRVRIIDPACGSGAFPMGCLQKMLLVLQKVDHDSKDWLKKQLTGIKNISLRKTAEEKLKNDNVNYTHKLGIIQSSIYGVDIQPIAVEISKLRFFLSLIVDEEVDDSIENRGVKPLPNLEFKFICANSLIGLPKQSASLLPIEDNESITRLQDLRARYFTSGFSIKEKIKKDFLSTQEKMRQFYQQYNIEPRTSYIRIKRKQKTPEYTRMLSEWNPFVDEPCSWFDAEWMFGIKDGFDIVIANPPYGLINKRQNKGNSIKISPRELDYYKKSEEYSPAATGMLNIYRLFILKSIRLLKINGILSEIFPLSFIADMSAAGLRKYILKHTSIEFIEAFPERDDEKRRVFEAAKMSVCILQLQNTPPKNNKFFVRIHRDKFIDTNNTPAFFDSQTISLMDSINLTIPLMHQKDVDVIYKIYQLSNIISQVGHCYTGEIDLTLGKQYLTDNPNDSPLIKGAIIDKYRIRETMSQGEIKFLNKKEYLTATTGKKSLHHLSSRIVMQGITGVNEISRLKMAIVSAGVFCGNSSNYIAFNSTETKKDINYYLGILNSKLLNYIFSRFSTNSNVNGYEVDNLPIPKNISKNGKKLISELVKTILDKRKEGITTSSEEKEIDHILYSTYNLSTKEIAIVEGRINK